ncbi:hypothetical protein GA0070610_3928 [Micromonospora echinofusca]|uniref:Uncharacterized protein n=1 Tax=Micromonospora echinofusca TaxID=47858 RepID=A0A1C5GD16_MICEH|nr:hypothetical protein [Micromonospora echinofusca]SCG17608.1 hypothetical protein GA0070610_3928 [Micromonospora echinofusca]
MPRFPGGYRPREAETAGISARGGRRGRAARVVRVRPDLPADEADALDWLAFEQAGVVTTAQVTRSLTEGTVRGRVRSGRWRSICRGVVLMGNGRLTRDQQLWVAVLAAGPRGRTGRTVAVPRERQLSKVLRWRGR